MEILHKRTSNNIEYLFNNIAEGEIGLVLDKGWIVFKGNDNERFKIAAKPIRFWISGTTNNGNAYNVSINGSSNKTTIQNEELFKVTSFVTSTRNMFYNCLSLISLDLSHFDTSNVTDMTWMFYYCTSLTSLDLSNFDTSKVTNMGYMFQYCSRLTSLDVSNFDTSKVISMGGMFYYCSSLRYLDVSKWNTSNVTSMYDMFSICSSLTSLDVSNFDTSKVTRMESMFNSCRSLTSLDVSNFDTSNVTKMGSMFYSCPSDMTITCKQAFKDWAIANASTMYLPTPLRTTSSPQWHTID